MSLLKLNYVFNPPRHSRGKGSCPEQQMGHLHMLWFTPSANCWMNNGCWQRLVLSVTYQVCAETPRRTSTFPSALIICAARYPAAPNLVKHLSPSFLNSNPKPASLSYLDPSAPVLAMHVEEECFQFLREIR